MATDDPGAANWDDAPCGLLKVSNDGLITAANARLVKWIGHSQSELVGKLQWNELLAVGSRLFYETQLAPVLELDGVLTEVMLELRRADGTRIPALVNAVRLTDASGATVGAEIALMTVPDRRAYEAELRAAREQAVQSSAADAQARRRLEVLAQASAVLASSANVRLVLGRLAAVLVSGMADWCVIYTRDPDEIDPPLEWAGAHADRSLQLTLERLAELMPLHAQPHSHLSRGLAGGDPVLLVAVSEQDQNESTNSAEVRALFPVLGLASAMVVPSTVRGSRIATIVAVRAPGRAPFDADDLADLVDIGARTGIVLDNLSRQAREHNNSVALQQALLTPPQETPELQIVTRYLPATDGNEIGGDWYDTFGQPDGTPIMVIGDVVGHDIHAAAAMGHLRGVIRTVGYLHGGTPAEILTHADDTARALAVSVLATCLVARIELGTESATLRWSNAGHPPPVVITHDGQIRLLDAPPDRPLGIRHLAARHDHTLELGVGDAIVLYTDGLIERTDEDIDVSINRLATSLKDAHTWSLDDICDWVVTDHRNARRDDIALLALRYTGPVQS